MLKNAPILAIRGVDTDENEPSKVSMKWGVPNRSCTLHATASVRHRERFYTCCPCVLVKHSTRIYCCGCLSIYGKRLVGCIECLTCAEYFTDAEFPPEPSSLGVVEGDSANIGSTGIAAEDVVCKE